MTVTPTIGEITSYFGKRTPPRKPDGTYGTSWHNGVDLGSPVGCTVVSPQAGTVVVSTYNSIRGHYVVVDHGQFRTLQQHLLIKHVHVGQYVSEGQSIGLSGNSGGVATHLHTEVHDGTTPINPIPWYNARGVTLGVGITVLPEHVTSPVPISTHTDTQETEDDMITTIIWCYDKLMGRPATTDEVTKQVADTAGWSVAQVVDTFLRLKPTPESVVRAFGDLLGRPAAQVSQGEIDFRLAKHATIRDLRATLAAAAATGSK